MDVDLLKVLSSIGPSLGTPLCAQHVPRDARGEPDGQFDRRLNSIGIVPSHDGTCGREYPDER